MVMVQPRGKGVCPPCYAGIVVVAAEEQLLRADAEKWHGKDAGSNPLFVEFRLVFRSDCQS